MAPSGKVHARARGGGFKRKGPLPPKREGGSGSGGDGSGQGKKKQKKEGAAVETDKDKRPFACPLFRIDPVKHLGCLNVYGLMTIGNVKEHLGHRCHDAPTDACPHCWREVVVVPDGICKRGTDEWDAHVTSCPHNVDRPDHWTTLEQKASLEDPNRPRQTNDPGSSDERQWLSIFDALSPPSPSPSEGKELARSPRPPAYYGPQLAEYMAVLVTTFDQSVLVAMLKSRDLHSDEECKQLILDIFNAFASHAAQERLTLVGMSEREEVAKTRPTLIFPKRPALAALPLPDGAASGPTAAPVPPPPPPNINSYPAPAPAVQNPGGGAAPTPTMTSAVASIQGGPPPHSALPNASNGWNHGSDADAQLGSHDARYTANHDTYAQPSSTPGGSLGFPYNPHSYPNWFQYAAPQRTMAAQYDATSGDFPHIQGPSGQAWNLSVLDSSFTCITRDQDDITGGYSYLSREPFSSHPQAANDSSYSPPSGTDES
ncbi:hypothetical protein B0T22DRAFT_191031 [Podospora appendiculata]|uniref:Uncharacterized protein n=1 Tax=Podospora appendiculata TaxID=314037 RepID=A0AAE0XCY5_9PEZI|nr:hypothetical protein B0T22DRAFT_191031 [Podospora appendiculata]